MMLYQVFEVYISPTVNKFFMFLSEDIFLRFDEMPGSDESDR